MGEIKWVAQYHAKDDIDEKVIKLGICQERHLTWIYFDFDIHESDFCASSNEGAIQEIERLWGYMDTFSWIK